MTPAQFQYAWRSLPDVEMRRAWPMAALESFARNFAGGKPDPNDTSAKTIPPERTFAPSELLPPWARPDWLDATGTSIPADAARDFLKHQRRVPSWALQVAPIGEIKNAAG